jgi:hypothetical protein
VIAGLSLELSVHDTVAVPSPPTAEVIVGFTGTLARLAAPAAAGRVTAAATQTLVAAIRNWRVFDICQHLQWGSRNMQNPVFETFTEAANMHKGDSQ